MISPDQLAEEPVKLEGFGPADLYQRREKIFTRFVGGVFQRLRFFTGWPLLAAYFLLPWLSWDSTPVVLFDLPAREFHIFSATFFPQDLWLLGWMLIISAFGLFTATTLVGRLWCGYTCPQTVWTAVFMWAEQLAEGPRHQRIRLDQARWSLPKLRKRAFKHLLWLGWAFLTGLTFVGYFTPIRELTVDFTALTASGWATFWVLFFTATTYVNAGWLREQVCIYMCPYARFQSAMFDSDTLVVSYDPRRGEPRGSRKRSRDSAQAGAELGDCIDCQLCVQVCPVGIDIRDGLQYECIGCAHCIDACNQVMDKMSYPRNLISYTTERELSQGATRWLRPRSIGYATALLVMVAAFTIAVSNRSPYEVDIVRERGELFQSTPAGEVNNRYSLRVLNKTSSTQSFSLTIDSDLPIRIAGVRELTANPGEWVDVPLTLSVAREAVALPNTPVTVRICDVGGDRCVTEPTTFLGPQR